MHPPPPHLLPWVLKIISILNLCSLLVSTYCLTPSNHDPPPVLFTLTPYYSRWITWRNGTSILTLLYPPCPTPLPDPKSPASLASSMEEMAPKYALYSVPVLDLMVP